jgi:hypothetical protein
MKWKSRTSKPHAPTFKVKAEKHTGATKQKLKGKTQHTSLSRNINNQEISEATLNF